MKIAVIVLAGVAAVAAVSAGIFAVLFLTDDADETAAAAPCGDREYGHISSLKPDGDAYRLRFDPAWFTSGVTANFGATPISVDELAELLDGQKPVDLFEPLDTGVWIRFDVDTVCSVEQQYVP